MPRMPEKIARQARREKLRQQLIEVLHASDEGDRLPPERELAQRFGVARETLRRAMEALQAEGLLRRRQGSGTFAAGQARTKRFQLVSFSEDMRERGQVPSSKLVSARIIEASPKLAQRLKISPGAAVHEIRRLRLADGTPMALETACIACERVPGFHPEVLAEQSLYALLEQRYGLRLKSALQQIHATVLDSEEAGLLDVPPFSPSLMVVRQVLAQDDTVIEYGKSLYRADRYRFEVNISRSAATVASARRRA